MCSRINFKSGSFVQSMTYFDPVSSGRTATYAFHSSVLTADLNVIFQDYSNEVQLPYVPVNISIVGHLCKA